MSSPRTTHWDAAVQVLRYLQGAPGCCLLYKDDGHVWIENYSDAGWAGSLDDRRSTIGYCVLVGGSLVFWKGKKKTIFARLSAKSEYKAMTHTV